MLLLDELVKAYAPQSGKRDPYWRPDAPPILEDVHMPSWSWRRPRAMSERPYPVAVLDGNAAWLSAASSVSVAHGRLQQNGGGRYREPFTPRAAGYWRITLPKWQHDAIMPPWGVRDFNGEDEHPGVWLPAPTAALVFELADAGAIDMPDVTGSWTCHERVRLRRWTAAIQERRLHAMKHDDRETYERLKLGYSQAVTIMSQHGKALVYRPDWNHAIRAQNSATMWRRAWAAYNAGHPPIAAGAVDELAFPAPVAAAWWSQWTESAAPVPVKIDLTGAMLGTMKLKAVVEDWNDDEPAGSPE